MASLRKTVSRSRLASLALLPKRTARVLRHDARVVAASARWLVTSREHHNYTYDLTSLNVEHLAWYAATVCDTPVAVIRGYLAELTADAELREHIVTTTARAARRGLADREVRFGRRMGWYAMVRARKPGHVVETGVDKGLGTAVLAAAMLRNASEGHPGRVTAVDINPEAGYLVREGRWSSVVDLVYADSVATLAGLDRPVDIFLHDSDHSVEHERREFATVEAKLSPNALLLTDNVTKTRVLPQYAETTGRRFLAFTERPAGHWYPGDGIGAAWRG
ncbi:MAG TPA: class I SAM-dependent methyltransferase [Micromonosporaceae bacterium]